jgi:hypothetical protein
MATEIRAAGFQAVGLEELELREDPRRWSWVLDRRMIVSCVSAISAVLLILTVATGMMSFHDDPLNALAGRDAGSEAPLDTSWAVEFRIIPDHPIGIELRKVGGDETIHLYEPRN